AQVLRAEVLAEVADGDVFALVGDLARPPRVARVPGRDAVPEIALPPGDPRRSVALALIADADAQPALPLAGRDGDDVDHARERVGAVEGRAGAAHHLDALDLVDVDRERLPERRAEDVVVDRPAVDEHEQLVAEATVEAAHRHVLVAAGDLHDVHA